MNIIISQASLDNKIELGAGSVEIRKSKFLLSVYLEVCGNFIFSFKTSVCPSSKLVILALVSSSPVLGLSADSSDKMPNDQGK